MRDNEKNPDTLPLRVIESEQIIDVAVHDATKEWEAFERSHAQELLAIEIPLENRINYLIPFIELTSQKLAAGTIAQRLGADVSWVKRITQRIGIVPLDELDERGFEVYPPLTFALLEEEWQWYQEYLELDDEISEEKLSEFLAKSSAWVRRVSSELGFYPIYKTLSSGRKGLAYPKTLIPQFRHIILVIPRDEDRYTVGGLASQYNLEWDWVKRRLDESGLVPEERISSLNGNTFAHYPEEADQVIRDAIEQRPGAAGTWMTRQAMANELNKDFHWVEARVDSSMGVMLRDDSGKPALHFPLQIFHRLKREVRKLRELPYATDQDFAVKAIARILQRSPRWVATRLPHTGMAPKLKLSKQNIPHEYYPEAIFEALQSIPDDAVIDRSRRPPYTPEGILSAFDASVSRDTKITIALIEALRNHDRSIPTVTTIQKYFGSLALLNAKRADE